MMMVKEAAAGCEARRGGAGQPRQSSRLAAKSQPNYAKRKYDGDEDSSPSKAKPKRRVADAQDPASKRRQSVSVKVKESKSAITCSENCDAIDNSKADGGQQSDKYCHFCQHAKVNMLACGNMGCTHRYCLYCLKTHLEEGLDAKTSCSWKDGVWHCPTCRHSCCCSSTDCDRDHRHCKAYRYRQRRADVATKRATAHALVSLSSSKPAHASALHQLPLPDCRSALIDRFEEKPVRSDIFSAPHSAYAALKVQSDTCSDEETSCDSDAQVPVPASDCPISRLLIAMACDKPKSGHLVALEPAAHEVPSASAVDAHLVCSVEENSESSHPEIVGQAMLSNGRSEPLGPRQINAVCGGPLKSGKPQTQGGNVVQDGKKSLSFGLDALAYTAAEALNRLCEGVTAADVVHPDASRCLPLHDSRVERTPPIEHSRDWHERRDQLSALSTPAFSPEFSALPNGHLPPESALLG